MNERKKFNFILFSIIFIVAFVGFFLGSRAGNTKVAEVEKQLGIVTKSVDGFKFSIKIQREENIKLRELHDKDTETIKNLRQSNSEISETNRKLGKLSIRQREIIREITSGNKKIRSASGTITIGIRDTIKEVDKLIEFIKNRED